MQSATAAHQLPNAELKHVVQALPYLKLHGGSVRVRAALYGAYSKYAGKCQTDLQSRSADAKVSQMANNVALDSIFHALADPTRRGVIQRLGRGPATVSELAEPFDMALPSFMKHVEVLERTRLIRTRKRGRIRTCMLERKNFAAAERWFDEQRAIWASKYRNLDNLLERLSGENHES